MDLFVYIVVWLILSAAVGQYAKNKGLDAARYVLPSLLLSPLVGFAVSATRAPSTENGLLRKCPLCAELVKSEAKICRYCQRELEPISTVIQLQPRSATAVGPVGIAIAMVIVVAGCFIIYFVSMK